MWADNLCITSMDVLSRINHCWGVRAVTYLTGEDDFPDDLVDDLANILGKKPGAQVEKKDKKSKK